MLDNDNKYIRVSYIMATKNRIKYLTNSFNNIREFYDKDKDELIIIDGASNDGSIDIINDNKDIVSKLISEPDLGEAHAFNKGLMVAKGEIIKFLTDDDYYNPKSMKYIIEYLLSKKELDALLCPGYFKITKHITINKLLKYLNINKNVLKDEIIKLKDFPYNRKYNDNVKNVFNYCGCGIGLFIKRSCIPKIGLFDISFKSVDSEYIARIIENKMNIEFKTVYLYEHYTHNDSIVIKNNELIHRDYYRILLRNRLWFTILKYWINWNLDPRQLIIKFIYHLNK